LNRLRYLCASAVLSLLLCGCGPSHGRPQEDSVPIVPSQVDDFATLYGQNCAGCHGVNGKSGAAIALADPVYLAIADDSVIRRAASKGVPGTPMPAFAQSAGGMLTDKQIDVIVGGIRAWAKPGAPAGQPPPYAAQSAGDPQRGAAAYRTFCSSCHGADGRGGSKASSIVDGSYLALVSDQQLRAIVIAGWPELGMPDWRGDLQDRPLSTQEITDVVAWLSSQRPQRPGQPYPNSSMSRANGESR
jgi:cytochrome c oxidase cbb3-type subunit III